ATGGRIGVAEVDEEIARLERAWRHASTDSEEALLPRFVGEDARAALDVFDRVQLEAVLRVCLARPTLSEAGRQLFDVSRTRKKSPNDADRLRKYLARFGLDWAALHGA